MQIRKNTKAFKTIVNIIEACKDRPDRSELVRLFITRAGQTIADRLYIDGIETEANLFYELNYQAIVNNLPAAGYQLHVSDELPGIYFLRGSNKTWDETPFEFAEIILKKFAGLPELPQTRKKDAVQKYALPTAREKVAVDTPGTAKKSKSKQTTSKQPDFDTKHEMEFTHLERLVYTQSKCDKRAVLSYYDQVADYLLPWLKDRMLWVRSQADTPTDFIELNRDIWVGDPSVFIPNWIQWRAIGKEKQIMLCNDKDHLLYFVEHNCLEFSLAPFRSKSPALTDYLAIAIESTDIQKTIEAAHALGEILNGLQLPSFIKTDGVGGLHVYLPLDSKDDFDMSYAVAEYLCKLTRLKVPELVTLNAEGDLTYGKVTLKHDVNAPDKGIIAPYSLVPGSQPLVATPLTWEELQPGLRFEDFNIETIAARLKREGDPFESFHKRKVNAEALLEQLTDRYHFLI